MLARDIASELSLKNPDSRSKPSVGRSLSEERGLARPPGYRAFEAQNKFLR